MGTVSLERCLDHLKDHGFLVSWSRQQALDGIDEIFGEVPDDFGVSETGALFETYYDHGATPRGREEGVIILDWRFGQETRQAGRDLLELCPQCPEDLELSDDGERVLLDGHSIDLSTGLAPLLDALNAAMTKRNLDWRYFSLDFECDHYSIVCRPGSFKEAIEESPFLRLD